MKNDLVIFTVEGCLEFPWDMLRYDSCWPYMSEDAAQINRRTDRDMNIQTRRIVLQGINRPTVDRWRSFSWRVVCIGIEREPHGPIKALAGTRQRPVTDGQTMSFLLGAISFPGAALFSAAIDYALGTTPDWKFRTTVIVTAWIALGLREYCKWAWRAGRRAQKSE